MGRWYRSTAGYLAAAGVHQTRCLVASAVFSGRCSKTTSAVTPENECLSATQTGVRIAAFHEAASHGQTPPVTDTGLFS